MSSGDRGAEDRAITDEHGRLSDLTEGYSMQSNPGATDSDAQQQQQQQQQQQPSPPQQQERRRSSAAPKQLLKNGVSSRKSEAFPPMLFSPLVFLLGAIVIVNSTRNTGSRFTLFDGLSAQLFVSPPGADAFADIISVEGWWDWLEALLPTVTRGGSVHGYNLSSTTTQSDCMFLTLSQTRPGCGAPASALLHAVPNRTQQIPATPGPLGGTPAGYQRMPTWFNYKGTAGATPGGSPDYPTWAPFLVRGMCANASASAALVMRRYDRRPALAAAARALLPQVPISVRRNLNQGRPGTPQFALDNASNALLCNFICDSITGCGTWTTVEEAQGAVAADDGGPLISCTLYALARDSPPAWVAQDEASPSSPPPNETCTSGQLPMQFSNFGTNWQCPGPGAIPRFAVEPGRPPSDGEGQMHERFYECSRFNDLGLSRHEIAQQRGARRELNRNSSERMHTESETCVSMGDAYRGYKGDAALVRALRRLNWVDFNTSSVMLTMMMENTFIKGAAFVRIRFKMDLLVGGAVRPSVRVDSVLPVVYEDSGAGDTRGNGLHGIVVRSVFGLYVMYILFDGVLVLLRHRRARRFKEWAHQNALWLVIDTAVFVSGTVFSIAISVRDGPLLATTSAAFATCSGLMGTALGFASTNSCLAAFNSLNSTFVGEQDGDYFCNDHTVAEGACLNSTMRALAQNARAQEFNQRTDDYFYADNVSQLAGTFVIFMLTLRMFRFLRLQPRLAIITNTLARAAPDLVHFLLVFVVVLVGFAASFNCNYGGEVRLFATPGAALFSTFYMAMGSYDDAYAALIGSGQGALGVQLLIVPFIFIVVLVMLNIFLAIVVDSYADVKDELQNAQRVPSVVDSSLVKLQRYRHSTARTATRWWQWVRVQAALALVWADPRECVAALRSRWRGLPPARRLSGAARDVEMAPVAAGGGGGGGSGGESTFLSAAPAAAAVDAAGLVARPVRDVVRGCLCFVFSLPACIFGGKAHVTRWPEMSRALDRIPDDGSPGGAWVSAALLRQQLPHLSLAQAQHLVDKYGQYGERFEREAAEAAGEDYVARPAGGEGEGGGAGGEGGGSEGGTGGGGGGGAEGLRKRVATCSESGTARRVSESEESGLLKARGPGGRDE